MSAEITVDSTWLLGTVAGVVGASFVTWTISLTAAWRSASKDRDSLLKKYSELSQQVAEIKIQLSYFEEKINVRTVIKNNLRQLSAAADQYYLENGVNETTFSKIVGPDKYIREIRPAMGERYDTIKFKQGAALSVTLASGEEIKLAA